MRWIGMLVLAGALAVLCAACFDYVDDCALALTCPPGTGGTSGTGGGTPAGCDPTQVKGPVADSCGVFVSPAGNDGNVGSQEKPLKTLGAAVAKGTTIYACAGPTPYSEAVVVVKAVTLFGALDCTTWTYDAAKKSVLTAGAGVIPLTLESTAIGAEVLDFAVTAADATVSGGSSIAVVADHTTATFTRCSLVAGKATDGTSGASGGMQATQADGGMVGGDAGPNGMGSIGGGNGGQNTMCSLFGGNGGNGGTIPNGDGQDGLPGDNGNGGAKGTGDTGTGCTDGTPGAKGGNGNPGAVMSGIGTLNTNGYHGVDGQSGTDGTNGMSGGGGGGSQGTTTAHGAGGGGGGAGGCAGLHGTGGTAAGSSIALVSVSASVSLMSCTLGAGNGGSGGEGGDGQFGQPGGQQGNGGAAGGGASKGCLGGTGGDGGNGGNGSGGLGGHSLGIASTGTAPMLDAATKAAISFGNHGTGGKGGNMDADGNHGADGVAASCWDFGSNAACKM